MGSWGIIAPISQMPLLLVSTRKCTAAILLMFIRAMFLPWAWLRLYAVSGTLVVTPPPPPPPRPFFSHSVKQVSENDIVPGITLNRFDL